MIVVLIPGTEGHEGLNQPSLGHKDNLAGWPAHHRAGAECLLLLNIERHGGEDKLYHKRTRATLLPAPTGTMVTGNHILEQSERGSGVVWGGTSHRRE